MDVMRWGEKAAHLQMLFALEVGIDDAAFIDKAKCTLANRLDVVLVQLAAIDLPSAKEWRDGRVEQGYDTHTKTLRYAPAVHHGHAGRGVGADELGHTAAHIAHAGLRDGVFDAVCGAARLLL